MKNLIFIILLILSVGRIYCQDIQYQDISGIDYESKSIIDSIRNSGTKKGIYYRTMIILNTEKLDLKESKLKDKKFIFIISDSNSSKRSLIVIKDHKVIIDTNLNIECFSEQELLGLCFDKDELPLDLTNGFFLPELPSNNSPNNFFLFYYFKDYEAYYFEVNKLKRNIFLDKKMKKLKREKLSDSISNCLVRLLNSIIL